MAQKINSQQPLADRMRPQSLDEFLGQNEIVGDNRLLRQAIENDKLFSMIFWGPPGCGKTTLARLIAKLTKSDFIEFSAVSSNKADIKKVIQQAQIKFKAYQQCTILFIDELHRFNKAQQDFFLPYVEDGTIILIGATTENPSFEVISPLLSRMKVFVFKPLLDQDIIKILQQALKNKERGLGKNKIKIDKKTLEFLAQMSGGDARTALNALDLAVSLAQKNSQGEVGITLENIKEALQDKALIYDKKGEQHYNIISAFIKSLRGSDPDAALYWLARMLEAGEDARFIARRMVILASEDIGNACPTALVVATATAQAVEYVGLPEAQLNLAQAATYLASAPKSNSSYLGLLAAKEDVKNEGDLPVPLHLRNASTDLLKKLNYGKDYKYPHNFENSQVDQQYLPDKLKNKKYYKFKK
ncbi:MAG: replication-associated recombination protein A [Patescibacteria group bacterium]|nr:replication-associated recombination protein A [Patescibacteria group bacterium]